MTGRNPVVVLELQGGRTQHVRSLHTFLMCFVCRRSLDSHEGEKVFTRCRDGTRLARLDEDARIRTHTQTLSQTGKYRQGLFKAHIPDARAAVTMAAILYVCVCVSVFVRHMNPPRPRSFLITDEEKLQIKTTDVVLLFSVCSLTRVDSCFCRAAERTNLSGSQRFL